jgi:hypothetical protein
MHTTGGSMFSRVLRVGSIVAAVLVVAACGDQVTAPRDVSQRESGVIVLPAIEGTACRYGGDYPFCVSPPPEGDEENTPGEEPPPPDGGGSEPPPDTTTATCDPQVDPTCEKALTSADSALIIQALQQYMRPDTAIGDTASRRRCGEMRRKVQERFDAGKVFRGRTDSDASSSHYGATYDRHIHLDPWLLTKAANDPAMLREVANTGLHEAAHTLDLSHPNGADALGRYSDVPFNLLNPGPNVCLR